MTITSQLQSTDIYKANARLENIQALRGLAALLVVFTHILVIEQKYSPDHILGSWMNIGLSGVDIFFVISGFIMVHVAMRKKPAPKTGQTREEMIYAKGVKAWLEFLFARISRIYPLYWLISLAVLLVWFWWPELVFSSIDEKPDIVKSFLLFPDIRPPLLAVGWTLIHEMGFYLVFSLFMLFSRKYLPLALLLWALIVFIAIGLKLDKTNAVAAIIFSPLSFEFLAGAAAGLLYHRQKRKKPSPAYIMVLGIAGFFIAGFILSQSGVAGFENHMKRALYLTLPGALMVYGFAAGKWRAPRFSIYLGDWSYALYLTHILSLSLMGRFWQGFASSSLWDNYIILPIMLLISIGIAALVYYLFERPMLGKAKAVRKKIFK